MAVKLVDVARRAGVSASIASRILNDDPGVRATAGTRARVFTSAADLGYIPNRVARSLRLSRAGAVGLLLPDVNNSVDQDLVRGASDAAEENDIILLLGRSERLRPASEQLRRLASDGRVDGLLVQSEDLPVKARRSDDRLPTLQVISRYQDTEGSVLLDDGGGARVAVEHLVELGHTRLGLIGGRRSTDTARRRERGFRESLATAGLTSRTDWITRLGYTPEDGAAAFHILMQASPRPTALVVSNVNAALGAVLSARELGVRVPDDISLVSIHDSTAAVYCWPPLTTVRMPLYDLGRRSVVHLLELISGGTVGDVVIDSPAPELVRRGSARML